jgi:glycerol transport system ATP-binding protein
MTRIRMEGLAHSYGARPRSEADYALKRFDFTWRDGGAYALLGPSGCGKTTMLNLISGLVRPSEGRIRFDDLDVTGMMPAGRNIAQVFQFPVIYDTMTVADNLAFPLRNRRLPEEQVRRRVHEIAAMLELEPLLARRAAGLTADQKQKISMGRGLVRADVAAILFDEPLTVIDPHLKWQLRRKLKQVHRQFNHTLIYVTHDQNEALTFAEEVVVMYDGYVVQVGTPQELFEAPAHTFVGYFIGSPGMNLLPAVIEGGRVRVPGTALALDAATPPANANKLEIGIRPEFLEIADVPDARDLEALIERVDDLGNFRLATVRLGEHRLIAKIDEGRAIGADRCHLRFPERFTKLYADSRLVA